MVEISIIWCQFLHIQGNNDCHIEGPEEHQNLETSHTRISYAGAPKATMPAWTQDRLDVQHKRKENKNISGRILADRVSNNAGLWKH